MAQPAPASRPGAPAVFVPRTRGQQVDGPALQHPLVQRLEQASAQQVLDVLGLGVRHGDVLRLEEREGGRSLPTHARARRCLLAAAGAGCACHPPTCFFVHALYRPPILLTACALPPSNSATPDAPSSLQPMAGARSKLASAGAMPDVGQAGGPASAVRPQPGQSSDSPPCRPTAAPAA